MKIFLTLIISFFSFSAFSQNLQDVYLYAKELQRVEQYDQAILTYQRMLFFDKEGLYRDEGYQNIGNCYLQVKDYANAANYFDLAYFSSKNDSTKIELIFKKSFSLMQTGNYNYAVIELLNLPYGLSKHNLQRQNFYLGVANYGMAKYEDSEGYFVESVDECYQKTIKEIFIKVRKVDKINPKTSKLLSTLVPGLGQYYNGDFKNGTNSLLLLSVFGALAFNTALKYSFMDAVVTVLPWYQRYYMGGYNKAENIAKKRKEEKINRLKTKLLTTISDSKK